MGFFSPGGMPYHRLNSLEMLKEHKQVMLALQK